LRVGLAGLLIAVVVTGVAGTLWRVGDGAGDDTAAPIDHRPAPDRHGGDGGATGPRSSVPVPPLQLHGAQRPGSAATVGAESAGDRAPRPGPGAEGSGALRPSGSGGVGTQGSSAHASETTATIANPGGSPSRPITTTTAPAPSMPPGATTTTSGPEAPPADEPGAGGLGGLLGGVLDILGVG
jgi:hypothetical protein